ncbi:hypothetical protein ABIC03_003061 [Bradyrhizobium sp. RT6a]
MQEVPVSQALLQFVRFGLPWDFGRTITIAHGDACPVVSPPAVVTGIPEIAMVSREAAANWIARSEPGDDTANGEAAREQRATAPQPPCSRSAHMKKHMAGSSTAAILRDARLRRAVRMGDEYAAASTQMDAAEPYPEEAPKRSSRRTRRSLRRRRDVTCESPACSRAEQPRRGQINNVGRWECRQYPGLMRTRASANTSGPDSTLARRPLVKLRSPLRRTAPNEENLFLLPDRA